MKRLFQLLLASLVLTPSLAFCDQRVLIDVGWRFHRGEAPGAQATEFVDAEWSRVDLPHDWSTESPPAADEPSSGAGGYHETGVGWYRLELPPRKPDERMPGQRMIVEFDGAYRNAEVWLNGKRLGEHKYGYTPFSFDLTEHASEDGPNLLAVRIDNSAQPNCRWYSGSGLYRHVWLRTHGPLSFVPNSVWLRSVQTSDDGGAEVNVAFEVENSGEEETKTLVDIELRNDNQEVVAKQQVPIVAPAGGVHVVSSSFAVPSSKLKLWSPDSPTLYTLSLRQANSGSSGPQLDPVEQRVGLRTLSVNAERGLLLNGEPVSMYGGNVHHDHGPLGAASFDQAEWRKARLLKQAGFNAVRTSHNPPAEAFLDACDAVGLLVIDEAFDNWRKKKVPHDYGDDFEEIWRAELSAMVLRDRRHPSVVMWSIGNEVYERGEESGFQYGRDLSALVRSKDPSRPVTAGICGLWGAGDWPKLDPLFESLDVCGYNYEIGRYGSDHERLPERVVYGSETYPVDIFKSWHAVETQPWVIGDFVWTAMDYLGEAAIGRPYPAGEQAFKHWEAEHFPWRGAACGDIDLLGRRQPISHHRQIVWDRGEKLYAWVVDPAGEPWVLTPWAFEPARADWSWDASEGKPLTVRVASRWPRVRLELNGEVIGEAATGKAEEFLAIFEVPYQPGELVAIGLDNKGVEQERFALTTAGPATQLQITPENTEPHAGRQSVVFVDVSIVDASGRTQPLADREVTFSVEGPAEIVAAGNASLTSRNAYASSQCRLHHGRAQVVLRSTGSAGFARLKAEAEGLPTSETLIHFKPILQK